MARRGRTVVVRGDPGIGKSALLDALGDIAVRQGVAVHVVRVLDFGQTTRERPMPAIVACLLGTTADASDSARRTALDDAVASGTLASSDASLAQDLINVEPEPA
jgi:predicted ATPase